MRICVIIPIHNEIQTIGDLVRQIRQRALEVVVIDDGSSDGSAEAAKAAGAEILRNEVCRGKGFSLRRGFEWAITRHYQGVLTMDGDGQHHPDDIENFLINAQKQNCGIINGNRFNNSKGMPWLRWLVNRVMSMILSLVCHQSIPDSQCGFRFISCDVLKYLELTSDGFEIESELLVKAAMKKIKIESVEIQTIYKNEHSKIKPVRDTIKFILFLTKHLFSADKL